MINRAGLIVRPKQLFLDWAARLDDSASSSRSTPKSSSASYGVDTPASPRGRRTGLWRCFATGSRSSFIPWSRTSSAMSSSTTRT